MAEAVCPHLFVLLLFNLTSGERWAYGLFLLDALVRLRIKINTFLYDINCRWSKWAKAYLAMLGWEDKIEFPVPPFHINMHDGPCKARNKASRIKGLGMLRGEPTEIFNSYFGRFSQSARYMSPVSRALLATVAAHQWNNRHILSFARNQCVALMRAFKTEARLQSRRSILRLHSILSPPLCTRSPNHLRRGKRQNISRILSTAATTSRSYSLSPRCT